VALDPLIVNRDDIAPVSIKSPGIWSLITVSMQACELSKRKGLKLYRQVKFDPKFRSKGMEWPVEAETMIGLKRVWRGGACIFMRAALNSFGIVSERLEAHSL
jgi:hypothetical protein